ncbi:DUF3313 family protein [Thiocapsa bogorovii]|uniref:DUF3313 family protein n=1 Tax=Thiocapsa bogorovii TaxID=521689 RepID=UPI001E4A6630|nr:DUF3313 family protein [Thiocapsa bogorovii]UHD15680.1 DUF3313 domain-containing protein [Thiocapsa bogorovii]
MLDRIKIDLKQDEQRGQIDPITVKSLADYFHDAIIEQLRGQYQVVREPGPDVLRLRVAVTEMANTYRATRVRDWLDSARSAGNH